MSKQTKDTDYTWLNKDANWIKDNFPPLPSKKDDWQHPFGEVKPNKNQNLLAKYIRVTWQRESNKKEEIAKIC